MNTILSSIFYTENLKIIHSVVLLLANGLPNQHPVLGVQWTNFAWTPMGACWSCVLIQQEETQPREESCRWAKGKITVCLGTLVKVRVLSTSFGLDHHHSIIHITNSVLINTVAKSINAELTSRMQYYILLECDNMTVETSPTVEEKRRT